MFPNPDGLELLDVGCGNGLFVKQAARKGFRAFGLESSPEAVEIARRDGLTSIIQGSVEDLGKRDQEFDILTRFHCLEHLKSPEDYLLNLKKYLRPPGHLLVQVPNTDSLQAKFFGSSWYGLDCPRHLCNFGERSLTRLLQSSGFSIQKVRYFSLRDNAAAMVSSLFPQLDPIAAKISHLKDTGYRNNWSGNLKELIYFTLFILAQPLAFIEAVARRGATLTVYARYTKA
jgi:SAM-dependent methyltransferase